MEKIKLTKGELKRQRDALRQYERFLPTLQLKKQQLQLEILHQVNLLAEKDRLLAKELKALEAWSGLLVEAPNELSKWITPKVILTGSKNIAGVDIPVFIKTEFDIAQYDLFITPLWLDLAIDDLREIVSLNKEISIIEKGAAILRSELRIATQRVNLFEKVRIPEAREAIRIIKIYIGDQMANAVGRSKIAKAKIEESMLEEAVISLA